MKLWKITHKETEKIIFVLAERWMDVRSFAGVQLETCGDFSKLTIEQSAPFTPGKRKYAKLKVPAFRLEWHGQAASNPSTLNLVVVACKTIEELYGEEARGTDKPTRARKPARKS